MGRLAIRVKETNDEELQASHGKATKQCSGCDPDTPGHVERVFCKRCGGTGQEPLSFCSALAQLSESRRMAAERGGKKHGDTDNEPMEDSYPDDDSLYVEY
jgi:hypothetical protein